MKEIGLIGAIEFLMLQKLTQGICLNIFEVCAIFQKNIDKNAIGSLATKTAR